MCFAIIVGKQASRDGAVLFGHNEQNFGLRMINYRKIPRMDISGGIRLKQGGLITNFSTSYSYLWAQSPGLEFSDNYFNEWGVAVAGDGCPTKEDSYQELVKRGQISEGGIGYMLPRIIAMQAQTARQGLQIAQELLTRFGYIASGRSLIIADPNEAWVMSIARGKSWVARRVPDDKVVVIPNVHVIQSIEGDDNSPTLASPGLKQYATARGWCKGDEPFSFRKAFNATPHPGTFRAVYGVDSRQWHAQGLLTGKHANLEAVEQLPFAITPRNKLSVRDVTHILRSHLEGTKFDFSLENGRGTPHQVEEEIDYCLGRAACNIATQESVVFQLRSWLPPEVGCIAWRASSVPCTNAFTPWYLGIEQTPDCFYSPASVEQSLSLDYHFNPPESLFKYDQDLAFWQFHRLSHVVDELYKERILSVRNEWKIFERSNYERQEAVEQKAMENRHERLNDLTSYTAKCALKALDETRAMVNCFAKESKQNG